MADPPAAPPKGENLFVDIPIAGPLLSSTMSVIAQAIANRQSQIARLQAESKTLTDCRADPGSLSTGGALFGSAVLADEGRRRRGEEGGIEVHDRLLVGTEEVNRQEVACSRRAEGARVS